jgi:uncharacterized protein (TIRG00374 family)
VSKTARNFLKFFLFLGLGLLLVWLSVRGLTEKDRADISDALHRADYTWILISILVGMLSHVVRAMRWKMLMEPLGHDPKLSNTFFAVMVGYFANYAVPRLGEVSRCGILTRYEKIPFGESFGTVVVERIVDMLCFFVLVVVVFFLQFNTLYDYVVNKFWPGLEAKLAGYGTLLYVLAAFFLVTLAVLVLLRKRIARMLDEKLKKVIDGFKEGLKAIGKLKRPGLFIFQSFFIWGIYYAMLHLCFLCLTETAGLSVGCALTTLLFGTLAVIITPGGLGAYPPAVAGILILYQVSYGTGTAVGWLIWLSQFVAIVIFGLLSLILLPLMNKENDAAKIPS